MIRERYHYTSVELEEMDIEQYEFIVGIINEINHQQELEMQKLKPKK